MVDAAIFGNPLVFSCEKPRVSDTSINLYIYNYIYIFDMDRPSIYLICANESYYLIDKPKTPVIYPFTSYQICDIPVIIGDLTITCGGLYIMWIEYTDIIGGLLLYIVLGCAWYHLAHVSGIRNVFFAVWRVYVWVQWSGVLYKKSMYAQTHTYIL